MRPSRQKVLRLLRHAAWPILFAGIVSSIRADVVIGTNEADVRSDLGAPAGVITAGKRKQLTYRQGVITLVEGRVAKLDPAMTDWLERRRRGEAPPIPDDSSSHAKPETPTPAPTESAEPSEATTPTTGRVGHFLLTQRMYPNPSGYFAGELRQAWMQALAANKDEPGTPESAVTYPAGSQSAFVYVPKSYNGTRRFGLYLDIRPKDVGDLPDGYQQICDQHELIWVSPDAAGNGVHSARRCALALDALATVKYVYRVDEQRIYVGGAAGGGTVAGRLAVLYPEFFRGVMISSRPVYLLPVRVPIERKLWLSHFPFMTMDQIHDLVGRSLRVVFFGGTNDPNFVHMQRTITQWTSLGFAVKGYEIQGMGHTDAPAQQFADGLNWVEGR